MQARKYHMIKNGMITSLVAVMYYKAVFEDCSMFVRVFGTVVFSVAIFALLNESDKYLALAVKKHLPAKEFEKYKKHMLKKIYAKAEQGADDVYLTDYVINLILHEERFEFKSSQVLELLRLVNIAKEKSA